MDRNSQNVNRFLDFKIANGRFIVKQKLGSGSFGEIFSGIDQHRGNKEVAIKLEQSRTRHPQLAYEARIYRLLHAPSSTSGGYDSKGAGVEAVTSGMLANIHNNAQQQLLFQQQQQQFYQQQQQQQQQFVGVPSQLPFHPPSMPTSQQTHQQTIQTNLYSPANGPMLPMMGQQQQQPQQLYNNNYGGGGGGGNGFPSASIGNRLQSNQHWQPPGVVHVNGNSDNIRGLGGGLTSPSQQQLIDGALGGAAAGGIAGSISPAFNPLLAMQQPTTNRNFNTTTNSNAYQNNNNNVAEVSIYYKNQQGIEGANAPLSPRQPHTAALSPNAVQLHPPPPSSQANNYFPSTNINNNNNSNSSGLYQQQQQQQMPVGPSPLQHNMAQQPNVLIHQQQFHYPNNNNNNNGGIGGVAAQHHMVPLNAVSTPIYNQQQNPADAAATFMTAVGGSSIGAGLSPVNNVVGIPEIHYYGVEGDYNVMVIDLCGPSLEDLFCYCGRRFSLKTICMLADQFLHRIQFLHSKYLIHRDLKPENFVMGMKEKAHHVNLIDYGLSKRYWDIRHNQHIPYTENKPLTGTARYCSVNTHLGIEQSRRDDLESIGYIILYFHKGSLPWQGIRALEPSLKTVRIGEKKISIGVEYLCRDEPPPFMRYMKYCRGLKFEETPDYVWCRKLFSDLAEKEGLTRDWIFDWVEKRQRERLLEESQSNNGSSLMDGGHGSSITGLTNNPNLNSRLSFYNNDSSNNTVRANELSHRSLI